MLSLAAAGAVVLLFVGSALAGRQGWSESVADDSERNRTKLLPDRTQCPDARLIYRLGSSRLHYPVLRALCLAWQDRPNCLRLQHFCLEAGLLLSLQHLGIEVFCPAYVLASGTGRSRRLRLQHFCFEFEKPSRLIRLQYLRLVKNTA